jgi:opacity protein-like surface antigen
VRTAIALALAIVGLIPGTASAQWTLRPFAGVNLGAEHDFVDLDDAAGRAQPTFGGAAGWESFGALGLEAELATSPKFLKGASGLIESGRVDTFFANANWRFGDATARFRPFVTGGIGAARVSLDDVLDAFTSTSNLLAANAGAGIIVAASTRSRVVADVRYIRSQYGDTTPAGLGEAHVAWWRISAGVSFRFE